ncbi:HEAT repeat domain-containing protein [Thermodesulfobacteriota bacterium]
MPDTIKDLIRKLKNESPDEKREAANALGEAARKGQDIGEALEALHSALSDIYSPVRVRAAWALSIFYFRVNDITRVERLIQKNDEDITYGVVQAAGYSVRKGVDIGPIIEELEGLLGKTKGSMLRGGLVDAITYYHIRTGQQHKSAKLLGHRDNRVRFGTAAVYRSAAMDNIDISPSLETLRERLADGDEVVQRTAAEALGYFHARKGQWQEIDRLLTNKEGKKTFRKQQGTMSIGVRQSLIDLLYRDVTRFNICSDIPSLIRAMEEPNGDIRRSAFALLRRAAEQGQNISALVPVMKNALADDDGRVRESAALALKTCQLKNDKGKRCPACLDCEIGLEPGRESESLDVLAQICTRMNCCAGELSQTIYRCSRCQKYFLSSYYDHTGFHPEQHIIEMISRKDAEMVITNIRKCKDPDNPDCTCYVHKNFMEKGELSVKGSRQYEITID